MNSSNVFSYSNVVTSIQSLNLVYHSFNLEKSSFAINVEILDKNDIPPAVIIPAGAIPVIVNPLPILKPETTIITSETIINFFFLFKFLYIFCNIHYQF